MSSRLTRWMGLVLPAALVAAVANDDIVVIPDGDTILDVGNRAFIYCKPKAIAGVEKLFALRK